MADSKFPYLGKVGTGGTQEINAPISAPKGKKKGQVVNGNDRRTGSGK